MKTLLLLRHAKSSWDDSALSDFDRPLNERGKHDAPRVGEQLREQGVVPDRVLSSTAKRARKTTKRVLQAAGWEIEPEWVDEFYLAAPGTYLARLQRLPSEVSCVMVVGHNPGLEDLLFGLTGVREHLPTAGLVQIELAVDTWSDFLANQSGRIVWQWRPKDED